MIAFDMHIPAIILQCKIKVNYDSVLKNVAESKSGITTQDDCTIQIMAARGIRPQFQIAAQVFNHSLCLKAFFLLSFSRLFPTCLSFPGTLTVSSANISRFKPTPQKRAIRDREITAHLQFFLGIVRS